MMMRSLNLTIAALAALALSASTGHASPIQVNTDSAFLGLFTLTNTTQPGSAADTLKLSIDPTVPGFLTQVNGQSQPGGIPAAFTNPITFTATPDGSGGYNISGVDNVTKTFGPVSGSSGVASLNLSLTKLSVNDGIAAFVGSVNSVGPNNLPGYDFSKFAQGGLQNLSLTAPSNFSEVLSTPGASATGVATFSEAVPEPTSVAFWGLALTGLLTVRRFYRARRPA